MDRQYPDYPQYDHRRPWTYHAAAPTTPLSSMYASTPSRPKPARRASSSSRPPRTRRYSERSNNPPRPQSNRRDSERIDNSARPQSTRRESERSDTRAVKRSIPHNGATCGNNLCDEPAIAPDERLCPGPKGLDLCTRCYKRFKVERRRAMEDRRAISDDWKPPRQQRRSSLPNTTVLSSQAPETAFTAVDGYEQFNLVPASPVQRSAAAHVEPVADRAPSVEPRDREPAKQPSPLITPQSPSEKARSFNSLDSIDLERQAQKPPPRSPRKHRSRQDRDEDRQYRNSRARNPSTYDEAEYFKYGRAEEDDRRNDRRCCCSLWSRKRKCVVFGSVGISVILLILIIALAVALPRRNGFKYTPSDHQVNNTIAFDEGGATRKSVNDTSVGIGAGNDSYTYYQGNASAFPSSDKWVSFEDMWTANLDTFKHSCAWLDRGDDNTPEMIQDIYAAIQDRANASLVDQRIILATVIQETNGCPLVEHTTSSGGTRNPGLMQSHNGHEYDPKHSRLSILLMIQDGTQGTDAGWGLVDNLNLYGNPYRAMRAYNSGYIPTSGDLSEKAGATACYVSDIANRLTGWVRAETECPDDME